MPNPPILGPDGTPFGSPLGQPKAKKITPQEFCSMVIDGYLQDMAKANISPIEALIEMGTQIPLAMIELVKQGTNGNTELAKEPLDFLIKRISAICWQMGFKLYFAFDYAGPKEEETEKEELTNGATNTTDTGRQVQGDGNEKNQSSSERPGTTGPIERN